MRSHRTIILALLFLVLVPPVGTPAPAISRAESSETTEESRRNTFRLQTGTPLAAARQVQNLQGENWTNSPLYARSHTSAGDEPSLQIARLTGDVENCVHLLGTGSNLRIAIVPWRFDGNNPNDVAKFQQLATTVVDAFTGIEPYASNLTYMTFFRVDDFSGRDVPPEQVWYNQLLIQIAGACDYNQIVVIGHNSGWAGGAPGSYTVIGSGTPPTCDPTTCSDPSCPPLPTCSWDYAVGYTALHETGHTFAGLRHLCAPGAQEELEFLARFERIPVPYAPYDEPINCGVRYGGTPDQPCSEWDANPYLSWVLPDDPVFGCYAVCDEHSEWYRPWQTSTNIMCRDDFFINGFTPVDRKLLFDVVSSFFKNAVVQAGSCTAVINWTTAASANSWVEYGPDQGYGSIVTSTNGVSGAHTAYIVGLTAQSTYHYRLVAQDVNGNTHASEDRTFSTGVPQILRVPDDYATIQAALAASNPCDSVQVASGTYPEHVEVPSGVRLLGSGPERTTIDGGGSSGSVVNLQAQSTIEGFTITGSGTGYFDSGIWHNTGEVNVLHNRFTGNSVGIFTWCWDPSCGAIANIVNNLFVGNTRAVDANNEGVHRVINNTVVGNGRGVVMNNVSSVAENNIVSQNTGDGLVGNNWNPTVRYNDVWGNGFNYSGVSPGAGSISTDPMLRNPVEGDFRLRAGSPAVGRGLPPNADMGALPFIPTGNAPGDFAVARTGPQEWTLSWASTGAAGYNVYLGSQAGLYTDRFDAQDASTFTLRDPVPGIYYVAVSAYDEVGDESSVSSEIGLDAHPIVRSVHLPVIMRD